MSWMLKNLERVMNTQKQRQEANQFTTEGLACHVLRPGQQWKKGKIRIAVEFIPDEPDPEEETEITQNQSLDEFRC